MQDRTPPDAQLLVFCLSVCTPYLYHDDHRLSISPEPVQLALFVYFS